tara:strand:+ start:7913 stop:8539 length:627 start_codon:yes stop_codon:yes gene_type:complete
MQNLMTGFGYDPNDPTHILLKAESRANMTAATFTYIEMNCINRPELNVYVTGAPFDAASFVVPEGYLLEVRGIGYKSFTRPTTARTDSYIGIGMDADTSGSILNSANNFATELDDFRMLWLDPNSQSDDFNAGAVNVDVHLECYPNMCNAAWEGALPTAGASGSYLSIPHLRPDQAVVQRVKACWSVGTGAWDGQKIMVAFGILKKVV